MYCFSGVVVVVVGGGGVNFLCLDHFLRNYKGSSHEIGSFIHLEELRSTLCSILRLDLLFYGALTYVEFLRLGQFLRNYKG